MAARRLPPRLKLVTCPMCLGEKFTREPSGDFICDGCGGRGLVTEFWASLLKRWRPANKTDTDTGNANT